MEHKKYDLSASLGRMAEILDSAGDEYRKYPYIPQEGIMEGHKGYFVDCAVLVSRLYFNTNDIKALSLAKVYDMYIGETKRIMAESELCNKIIVHGNTIVGVYNTGKEGYLNELLDVAGRLISLTDVINAKVGRKDSPLLGNVCALETGYLFAVKADEGLDYFGGMLNRTEGWIAKPEEEKELRGLYISQKVRDGLKEQYQRFFQSQDSNGLYHGMIENVGMARWVKEQ